MAMSALLPGGLSGLAGTAVVALSAICPCVFRGSQCQLLGWLPNSSANDSGGSHAGTPRSVVALELAQHVEMKARPWCCVVMAHAHPVSAGRPSSS
jgi:hypothetical protein